MPRPAHRSQREQAGVIHQVRIIGGDHHPAAACVPGERRGGLIGGRHRWQAAGEAGAQRAQRLGAGWLHVGNLPAAGISAADCLGKEGRPAHARLPGNHHRARLRALQRVAHLRELLGPAHEPPRHPGTSRRK